MLKIWGCWLNSNQKHLKFHQPILKILSIHKHNNAGHKFIVGIYNWQHVVVPTLSPMAGNNFCLPPEAWKTNLNIYLQFHCASIESLYAKEPECAMSHVSSYLTRE